MLDCKLRSTAEGDPFVFADFLDLRERIQSALFDPFTDFRLVFGAVLSTVPTDDNILTHLDLGLPWF